MCLSMQDCIYPCRLQYDGGYDCLGCYWDHPETAFSPVKNQNCVSCFYELCIESTVLLQDVHFLGILNGWLMKPDPRTKYIVGLDKWTPQEALNVTFEVMFVGIKPRRQQWIPNHPLPLHFPSVPWWLCRTSLERMQQASVAGSGQWCVGSLAIVPFISIWLWERQMWTLSYFLIVPL